MNRNLINRTIAIAALGLLTAGGAFATSDSDSATADASATVVSAISITKSADLDFGDVVASGTAGTVVMGTDGARSVGGGATLGNAGSASAASFSVTGDSGATYSITLPSSTTLSDGGTGSMTVDGFTSDPDGTGTLTGGSETVAVGATLNVGADQAVGSYTGTFTVSVSYN